MRGVSYAGPKLCVGKKRKRWIHKPILEDEFFPTPITVFSLWVYYLAKDSRYAGSLFGANCG